MAVTVTVTAKESAAGLSSSWDQCSEPKGIRMGLREARKQAKCKSRRDQLPVKVCLSFLWCVGRTGSKVRTAVSDENRCSLGLNVGHGGRGRGGEESACPSPPRLFPADIFALTFPRAQPGSRCTHTARPSSPTPLPPAPRASLHCKRSES